MNSNIHPRENGLCIVPAMLAHCWEPVTVTTSLKKYLTHEYQWSESHDMTWLDNLWRGNARQGAWYAPARLIDLTVRYSLAQPKWTSDVFMCWRINDAHVQSVSEIGVEWLYVGVDRLCVSMYVRTCEVCVVWGVDEIVREGKGHVFTLVQLLRGDDGVLLPT